MASMQHEQTTHNIQADTIQNISSFGDSHVHLSLTSPESVPKSVLFSPAQPLTRLPSADVRESLKAASYRWLKPVELHAIFAHLKSVAYEWQSSPSSSSSCPTPLLSSAAPVRPSPGCVYAYSKAKQTKWRKDQYQWNSSSERHTKLKLRGVEIIACYYSKSNESFDPVKPCGNVKGNESYLGSEGSFHRRSYYLISEPDVVLVHYLDNRIKGAANDQDAGDDATDVQMSGFGSSSPSNRDWPTFDSNGAVDLAQLSSVLCSAAGGFDRCMSNPAPSVIPASFPKNTSGRKSNPNGNLQNSHSPAAAAAPTSFFPASSNSGSSSSLSVLDYSPSTDVCAGGTKMMFCLSSSSESSLDVRYYCHFLQIRHQGLQVSVAVMPLERIAGSTYRAVTPRVASAGSYVCYVSDSPSAASVDTRVSLLFPFEFREAVSNGHASRSRDRQQESDRGQETISRSPSVPKRHKQSHQRPTQRDNHSRVAASSPQPSHEREFITAIIRRFQAMERTIAGAQTVLSPFDSMVSPPTDVKSPLAASPEMLNLRNSNPFQPSSLVQLPSPLSDRSSESWPHSSSSLPNRLSAAVCSLSDLESCILDASGEDVVESLLLCMLKKLLAADAATIPASTNTTSAQLLAAAQVRDSLGRQLIHYIAGLGYTNLLTIALSQLGAQVNSPDSVGRTPLHHATLAEGQASDEFDSASSPACLMVSALLSYGGDDRLLDNAGRTPMALADAYGRRDVVQLFLELSHSETTEHDAPAPRGTNMQDSDFQQATDEMSDESDMSDEDNEGDEHVIPAQIESASRSILSDAFASNLGSSSEFATSAAPSSSPFSLDRAFSSLTLHDMGINASDFALPSASGVPATPGASMSASELFASPPDHFNRVVSAIQRQIRWWLVRRHAAANKLQSVARGMLARRSIKRMREASVTIQAHFRKSKVRRDFVKLQRATRLIQEKFRETHQQSHPQIQVQAQPGIDDDTHVLNNDDKRENAMPSIDESATAFDRPLSPPFNFPFSSAVDPNSTDHMEYNSTVDPLLISRDFELVSATAAASQALLSPDSHARLLNGAQSESIEVNSSARDQLSPYPLSQMSREADLHPMMYENMQG